MKQISVLTLHERASRFNYYLNILWFQFKCAIFKYNCTYLCFMCCYSAIMFYCFPMLNDSKFTVCIMLMLDAFLLFDRVHTLSMKVTIYIFIILIKAPQLIYILNLKFGTILDTSSSP